MINGKISFGVDYFGTMLEVNERSRVVKADALALARVLLVLEWGLTAQEQDEAHNIFWEKVNNLSLDEFHVVANRLIEHVKDMPEAKTKLLTDLMVVARLDGDLSDGERKLIDVFAQYLDFRSSEVQKLFERAADIVNAFAWFAEHNNFLTEN